MPSFPVPRTRLPVRFLSSLPVPLPQPLSRCFPSALAFGLFCFRSTFLSIVSLLLLTTQPSALPFLFLPVSASQRLPRCALSALASLALPVLSDLISHVRFPGSSYSAFLQFLSPSAVSPHSGYPSASAFSLSVPGLLPLALALGSGYLAWVCILFRCFPAAPFFSRP